MGGNIQKFDEYRVRKAHDGAQELLDSMNKTPRTTPKIGLYGWICPNCLRGNAPTSSTCPCVNPPNYTVTC